MRPTQIVDWPSDLNGYAEYCLECLALNEKNKTQGQMRRNPVEKTTAEEDRKVMEILRRDREFEKTDGGRLKKGTRKNPPEVFTVGVTYEIVTQESAENNDAEERGWESELEPMTLRDALDTINKYGPYDHAQVGFFDDVIFYGYGETNYRTGEQVTYDVVVKGSDKDLMRLMAFYNKRSK